MEGLLCAMVKGDIDALGFFVQLVVDKIYERAVFENEAMHTAPEFVAVTSAAKVRARGREGVCAYYADTPCIEIQPNPTKSTPLSTNLSLHLSIRISPTTF